MNGKGAHSIQGKHKPWSSNHRRLLSTLRVRSAAHSTSAPTLIIVSEPAPNTTMATRLPTEILVEIFRCIERVERNPIVVRPAVTKGIYNMALVCKSWYGPFTKVAYETIEFPRVSCVFRFLETLQTRPHLRSLVKSLLLPARVGVPCPDLLVKAFVKIIHLTESLEHLYVTCPFLTDPRFTKGGVYTGNHYLIPVSPGRHSRLKYLLLYTETKEESIFPLGIAYGFSQLTFLSLNGFCLREEIDPEKVPVLSKLRYLHVVGGSAIIQMDRWLVASPALTDLVLCYTELPDSTTNIPPISILQKDKITRLTLTQMFPPSKVYQGTWLTQCSSVRILSVSWDLFSSEKPLRAASQLEWIALTALPSDNLSIEPFQKFLSTHPYIRYFELRRCAHDKWVQNHTSRLMILFGEAGVRLTINEANCRCQQGTSALKERLISLPRGSSTSSRKDAINLLKWEWTRG